jgi:hypothetical protein
MYRFILSILVTVLMSPVTGGQELPRDTISFGNLQILNQMVKDGDTILHSTINEVVIYPVPQFTSRRDLRRYHRLVHNLKVVHPYAVLAAEKLDEMNEAFTRLSTKGNENNL